MKINRKLNKTLNIAGWVLLIILLIIVVRLLIWEDNYYKTQDSAPRSKSISVLTQIETATAPSTIKPTDEEVANHTATEDNPLRLYIERLEVDARILITTAGKDNTLPVPRNIHDALWYGGSAKPGENGTVIISGLSGYNGENGVFANLEVLEKGDKIVVENGRHNKYTYEVAEIHLVGQNDIHDKLSLAQNKIDNEETLSLITARSETSQSEYDSVVFIKAKLKEVKKAED